MDIFYLLRRFILICCSIHTANLRELRELSIQKVEHLILNRQWDVPFCILFSHKQQTKVSELPKENRTENKEIISSLEKIACKLQDRGIFKEWIFGKIHMDKDNKLSQIPLPPANETLRCYVGTASPFDFNSKDSLKKWRRKMVTAHRKRLQMLVDENIEVVFQNDLTTEIFIFTLPGSNYFQIIEPKLYEIRESCKNCRILVIPSGSEQERLVQERFNIHTYPTALIFHRKRQKMSPQLKATLEGLHTITKETVLLHALIMRIKAPIMSFENFKSTALVARHNQNPLLVCFYSSSNPASYNFIHAFNRTVAHFTKSICNKDDQLRFGLVDLAEAENSKILSRYIEISDLKKIPFISLFWQDHLEGHAKHEIRQTILPDMAPTPWNIKTSLNEFGIHVGEQQQQLKNQFCYPNSTLDTCDWDEEPPVYFGPILDKDFLQKMKHQKPKSVMKYLMGIPIITDKLWSQIIERSSFRHFSGATGLNIAQNKGDSATVKLVIFIMADCGFCEIMMPKFSNLSKVATRMHGVSVFLMNCTSDPVECKKNGVTGYPTLALFRSISEEESKNCLMVGSHSSSTRLDYHGNMEVDDILKWLSKAAMSAVEVKFGKEKSSDMEKDVRLVAHLYTRSLARKYLSRSLQQKLIPLQCFKLACEKLFGTVECIAQPSEDVVTEQIWKRKVKEKDLVLEKVIFERRDGANATVIKVAYPMNRILEGGKDRKLHKFHRKHRYRIPTGFHCEDNHPLCIDILVKFVEDHQRLPITHITRESFHAHGTTASIFSKEFPVLIALVHKSNISNDSPFLKELQEAAETLYTKIIIATLNVDEFPSWASQFVPRDYHYKHHDTLDKIPALYQYPRFCIIDWEDHQHAAFYPPLNELEEVENVRKRLSKIMAKDLVEFTSNYLTNRDRVVVETEMF